MAQGKRSSSTASTVCTILREAVSSSKEKISPVRDHTDEPKWESQGHSKNWSSLKVQPSSIISVSAVTSISNPASSAELSILERQPVKKWNIGILLRGRS